MSTILLVGVDVGSFPSYIYLPTPWAKHTKTTVRGAPSLRNPLCSKLYFSPSSLVAVVDRRRQQLRAILSSFWSAAIMGRSIRCHQLHLWQCMQTIHRFGTLLCLACRSTISCCLCRAEACKPHLDLYQHQDASISGSKLPGLPCTLCQCSIFIAVNLRATEYPMKVHVLRT